MAASTKGKGLIDDTTPMMCTIEGIAKKEHVDYIMKVQRGISPDDSWQLLPVFSFSDYFDFHIMIQLTPDNLNLQGKLKKVRVMHVGSSSY